ncbi:protein of unknown function [Paraburkholderia dioscoreae]|uniref:Uncharacterized protein n=1 Tax=Paraburkholderia dioscoreae TaxID=2604047 RepID=A0A5Q4Z6A5_9BURK|nr:protein of unknown function [Paraburkholderia dioscoreae]
MQVGETRAADRIQFRWDLSFFYADSVKSQLLRGEQSALARLCRICVRPLPLPFPVSSFDVDLCWQLRPEDSAAQQWLCDTIARTVSGA